MRMSWSIVWMVVKILIPVALLAGVGWHFARVLSRPELSETPFQVRPGWLLLCALLYVAGHTIWAAFWTELLRAQSVGVPARLGFRAYFISLIGKYVPGKAWVILLRVAILRKHVANRGAVALAATYEALTTMAAGALIGLFLLSWLGERAELFRGREWVLGLMVGLPMLLGIAHRLIGKRMRSRDFAAVADSVTEHDNKPRFRLTLLVRGLFQAGVGWALIGLSFWACVRGLTPWEQGLSPEIAVRFTAMIALAYVIGFAALLVPGGVGIREWLIQAMLTAELVAASADGSGGDLGPAEAAALAVVVALVLRLVWTSAEMLLIGMMYLPTFSRRKKSHE